MVSGQAVKDDVVTKTLTVTHVSAIQHVRPSMIAALIMWSNVNHVLTGDHRISPFRI